LGCYVREKKILQAGRCGEKNDILTRPKISYHRRGILQPGMLPILLSLTPIRLRPIDFEHPHAYSTGFKYVLVNGTLTVDNFKHIGARKGVTLRGPGYHQIYKK